MNEEIKELQKQLAEVKRQKEALHEKMQKDAIDKAKLELKMKIHQSKLQTIYFYLDEIQNSKFLPIGSDLIYNLFSILEYDADSD